MEELNPDTKVFRLDPLGSQSRTQRLELQWANRVAARETPVYDEIVRCSCLPEKRRSSAALLPSVACPVNLRGDSMKLRSLLSAVALASAALSGMASIGVADDWPQFRGPNR